MVKLDKKGRPVEDKEARRRRIAANLAAQEKVKSYALPIVGAVFLALIVVLFIGSNLASPYRVVAPPGKGEEPK